MNWSQAQINYLFIEYHCHMGKYDGPSRCSGGKDLTFRWFGYPQANESDDIQVATDKFIHMLEGPNRITNGYIGGMARAEFRKKVALAGKGQLWPVTGVAAVDKGNPPPLYEIRWQGITIREDLGGGVIRDLSLIVRKYHSEPSEAPDYFIGHHVHEKDVSDREAISELQNVEILVAKRYFELGLPTLWGISKLTSGKKSIN